MAEGTIEADAIVVGGGSAGAVAARRLIDAGLRVLLLEAGGPDTNPAIHVPARVHELWLSEVDWAYQTVPQAGAADRRLHWPRGKVLGGSGALNGMIHVRGAPADYDAWAYLGNPGWGWADVLPIFIAMEDYDRGASEFHGVGGPLRVNTTWEPSPIHQAIRAAAEQCGIPFNEDCNDGEPDGFSYVQMTTSGGRRQNSAIAYLGPVLEHEDLTVELNAQATALTIERGRCVGVEFESEGRSTSARASTEVILAAGTIESPRLLMLSGIGPADHLREHGIDVTVDLRGVGGNLHDHILSPVIYSAEREIGPPPPDCWAAESHLFWRTQPGMVAPDIQPIHFGAPLYEPWMEGPANGFSMLGGLVRPVSRGTLRLTSSDPQAELAIDPRALSCAADVDAVEAAVNLCREMGAAPALSEWGARELYPGPEVKTSAELRDYIRRTAITYHHQVGTCKMGTDEDAVVDPQLRVYGVEGLRVADASVMPTVTSGNTNAASLMIGERVAALVSAEHRS